MLPPIKVNNTSEKVKVNSKSEGGRSTKALSVPGQDDECLETPLLEHLHSNIKDVLNCGHLQKPLSENFLSGRGFFVSSQDGHQLSIPSIKSSENIGHLDYYVQSIAKPYTQTLFSNQETYTVTCGSMYIYGECDSHFSEKHQVIKGVRCGREWCTVCGVYGSDFHVRRMSRWWDKIFSMPFIGYMVVTFPLKFREELRNVVELKAVRRYIVRKLKDDGYKKGLVRWHWAGEDGINWHPHLNIIIPAAHVDADYLAEFKADVLRWLNSRYSAAEESISIHYGYGGEFGYKFHKLKYITRATLRRVNLDLQELLRGFRTTQTWGKWDNVPKCGIDHEKILAEFEREENEMRAKDETFTADEVKKVLAVKKIQAGHCPCCNGKIKWMGVRGGKSEEMLKDFENVGGGYHVRVFRGGLQNNV